MKQAQDHRRVLMRKQPIKRLLITVCLLFYVFFSLVAQAQAQDKKTPQWDYAARVVHVPILMYHYIDKLPEKADLVLKDLVVSRKDFEAQMKWLKDNGYTSITPD